MYNQVENINSSVYQSVQFPVVLVLGFHLSVLVTHPSQKDILQTISGESKEI